MHISRHARTRAAQRDIPPSVIGEIYRYGSDYAARGATGLRMDRAAYDRAAEDLDHEALERLRRFARTYLVISGDTVITAGDLREPFVLNC